MNLARHPQRRAPRGYSLVELLLTTALLLLFAGLAVVSMKTISQGSALNEGTIRFETMLRFARAESAHLGRRVRVNFVQETNPLDNTNQLNSVQLAWEPDPMGEPDTFQDLAASQWGIAQVNETIGVEAVRLLDTAETPSADSEEVEDFSFLDAANPAPPASITFNPNGSCDSAEITLAGRNAEDDRRVIMRIEGFTGYISRVEPVEDDAEANSECPETDRQDAPAEDR